MNKFKRGALAVPAALALWAWSAPASGMGLGRPITRAILGDTLAVSVPVRLEPGEELATECVRAEVQFGDDKLAASAVQVSVRDSVAPVGRTATPMVQVRTSALINEPVVTVTLTVGCQARITRKWVSLVDPPDVQMPAIGEPASAPTSAATAAQAEPDAGMTRPLKAVRDPISRTSGLGHKAPSFSLAGGEPSAADQSKAVRKQSSARKAADAAPKRAVAPVREAPRLELDPVATEAAVLPGLQMAQGLTVPPPQDEASSPELLQRRRAAAAIWQAMNASPEELARERDRLEEVERRLDALTRDNQRASEAVAGLQGRLARPDDNQVVVYGLGALVVFLAGVLAWRERALRRALAEQSGWLPSRTPEELEEMSRHEGDTAILLSDIHDVVAEVDAEPPEAAAPVVANVTSPAVTSTAAPVLTEAGSAPQPRQDSPKERLRDVSVDELIDLEQQAEFFLVLGQDESAIEVLEGYIRTTSASSPMPFLKLLEIYRRQGMRTDYERTRMNFNLRFNAHAPLWDADPTHGHELKDYPGIIERLQALWPNPDQALEVLERSLMRQDAESYTFDLPAYRELLFLYAILRDLTEDHGSGMHHGHVMVASSPSHRATTDDGRPLMATLPMKALPEMAPVLSLDLELDDLYIDPPDLTHKP